MKPPACSSHGPNAGCSRALGEGPSLGGASVTPNGQQAQGHGFNWLQCLSERDECVGPAAPGSGSSSRVHAPSLSLQRPSGRSPVFPTSRNFGGINEYTDLSEMHSLENYTRNSLAPQGQIPTECPKWSATATPRLGAAPRLPEVAPPVGLR